MPRSNERAKFWPYAASMWAYLRCARFKWSPSRDICGRRSRLEGPGIVRPARVVLDVPPYVLPDPLPDPRLLNPRLLLLFREIEVAGVDIDLFHIQASHCANAVH